MAETPRQLKKIMSLGRGSTGEVYLAKDRRTNDYLAVKRVNLDKVSLDLEVEILRKHQHPNIVQYLGVQRKKHHANIFLEYVTAGSLQNIIQQFGKLDEVLVKVYTTQILQGLSFLHAHNVLHRDIKPANILVSHEFELKLSDFGSAKKFDRNFHDSPFFTVENHGIIGTPCYIPKEVIVSSFYSPASDIWAVGCTVLEMLTGERPWAYLPELNTPLKLLSVIASSQKHMSPLSDAHIHRLSVAAIDFLRFCFLPNPSHRPSANDLLSHPFLIMQTNCTDQLSMPVDDGLNFDAYQSDIYAKDNREDFASDYTSSSSSSSSSSSDNEDYQIEDSFNNTTTSSNASYVPLSSTSIQNSFSSNYASHQFESFISNDGTSTDSQLDCSYDYDAYDSNDPTIPTIPTGPRLIPVSTLIPTSNQPSSLAPPLSPPPSISVTLDSDAALRLRSQSLPPQRSASSSSTKSNSSSSAAPPHSPLLKSSSGDNLNLVLNTKIAREFGNDLVSSPSSNAPSLWSNGSGSARSKPRRIRSSHDKIVLYHSMATSMSDSNLERFSEEDFDDDRSVDSPGGSSSNSSNNININNYNRYSAFSSSPSEENANPALSPSYEFMERYFATHGEVGARKNRYHAPSSNFFFSHTNAGTHSQLTNASAQQQLTRKSPSNGNGKNKSGTTKPHHNPSSSSTRSSLESDAHADLYADLRSERTPQSQRRTTKFVNAQHRRIVDYLKEQAKRTQQQITHKIRIQDTFDNAPTRQSSLQ